MILGRPTNLWLGLTTSIVGLGTVLAIAAGVDPTLVGNVAGSVGGLLGAIILVIANQPPTLATGDTYTKITPAGQPNTQVTV